MAYLNNTGGKHAANVRWLVSAIGQLEATAKETGWQLNPPEGESPRRLSRAVAYGAATLRERADAHDLYEATGWEKPNERRYLEARAANRLLRPPHPTGQHPEWCKLKDTGKYNKRCQVCQQLKAEDEYIAEASKLPAAPLPEPPEVPELKLWLPAPDFSKKWHALHSKVNRFLKERAIYPRLDVILGGKWVTRWADAERPQRKTAQEEIDAIVTVLALAEKGCIQNVRRCDWCEKGQVPHWFFAVKSFGKFCSNAHRQAFDRKKRKDGSS